MSSYCSILNTLIILQPFLTYFLINSISNTFIAYILIFLFHIAFIFYIFNKKSSIVYLYITIFSFIFSQSSYGYFIRPTDNVVEIFYIYKILENGKWFLFDNNLTNKLITVIFFPTITKYISNINILYFYKFILPFIASYTIIPFYIMLKKYFQFRISFLSIILFTSLFIFNSWGVTTLKMTFSMIFSIFVFIYFENLDIKYKFLTYIFVLSLIFSHYGSSIILFFIYYITYSITRHKHNYLKIVLSYIIIFHIYYNYIKNDFIITYIVNMIKNFLVFNNFISINRDILRNITLSYSILTKTYVILLGFSIIGHIFYNFYNIHNNRFKLISLIYIFFVLIPYVLPVNQYSGGRLWLISSLFYCPFAVYFLMLFFNHIFKEKEKSINVVLLIIIVFFMINVGVIFELLHENTTSSIYISKSRIDEKGYILERDFLDRAFIYKEDWFSMNYLKRYNNESLIYCDYNMDVEFWLHNFINVNNKISKGVKLLCSIRHSTPIKKNSVIMISVFNRKSGKFRIDRNIFPTYESLPKYSFINIVYNNNCKLMFK